MYHQLGDSCEEAGKKACDIVTEKIKQDYLKVIIPD